MTAPPRWAMARAASSRPLGVWHGDRAGGGADPPDPRLGCRPLRFRAARRRASTSSPHSATRSATGTWARCCGRRCERARGVRTVKPGARATVTLQLAWRELRVQLRCERAATPSGWCRRAWWWPPTVPHSLVKQAAGIASERARLSSRWRWWPTSAPIARARAIAYERFTAAGPLALLPLARWRLHRGVDAAPRARGTALQSATTANSAARCSALRLARGPIPAGRSSAPATRWRWCARAAVPVSAWR